MAVIRIVTTDMVSQQLHAQALKENRTLSKMGEILLRKSLERRREASASTQQIVSLLRGKSIEATP